MPKKWL